VNSSYHQQLFAFKNKKTFFTIEMMRSAWVLFSQIAVKWTTTARKH